MPSNFSLFRHATSQALGHAIDSKREEVEILDYVFIKKNTRQHKWHSTNQYVKSQFLHKYFKGSLNLTLGEWLCSS